jgi:hypothetical protein
MGISSVSFRWSRKEGMKHNFWSPKSTIIRFLAKNVWANVFKRVLYIVLVSSSVFYSVVIVQKSCWSLIGLLSLLSSPSDFICSSHQGGVETFFQERGNLMYGGHSVLERYSKESCVFGMLKKFAYRICRSVPRTNVPFLAQIENKYIRFWSLPVLLHPSEPWEHPCAHIYRGLVS